MSSEHSRFGIGGIVMKLLNTQKIRTYYAEDNIFQFKQLRYSLYTSHTNDLTNHLVIIVLLLLQISVAYNVNV